MKRIFYIFALSTFFAISFGENALSLDHWPWNCQHAYQGGDFVAGRIGDIDCNVSSASFPGQTPMDRCLTVNFPGYVKNGKYKVDNYSQHTYFIPLASKDEWEAFVASAEANNFKVEICEIKGQCGSAVNSQSGNEPPSIQTLCAAGAASEPIQISSSPLIWSWTCVGTPSGGANDAQCQSLPTEEANGKCGTANNSYFETAPPNEQLCASGSATLLQRKAVASTTPIRRITVPGFAENEAEYYWEWTCESVPSGAGTSETCKTLSNKGVDALCGIANGQTLDKEPLINQLCELGSPVEFSPVKFTNGSFGWSWVCKNGNTGKDIICSAMQRLIDANCGESNLKTFSEPPTTGLCRNGTPTDVSKITNNMGSYYTWSCEGAGGGRNIGCYAIAAVATDGLCGSLSGGTVANISQPYPDNMCSKGTPTKVYYFPNTLTWNWVCAGTDGGLDSPTCTARGTKGCGSLDGKTLSPSQSMTANTPNLCSNLYSASSPTPSNVQSPPHLHFTWNWTCTGGANSAEPGKIYNCAATGTTGCPFSGGNANDPNPCNYPD